MPCALIAQREHSATNAGIASFDLESRHFSSVCRRFAALAIEASGAANN